MHSPKKTRCTTEVVQRALCLKPAQERFTADAFQLETAMPPLD
ncbi:hypothetical protein IMCC9480_279 [Oxalobacteraceae bacterium IMCC9480]|nr:hypothetical protein IMCC9480_279 [Oxalobacteraceae bacterium IMCC9480]